MDKYKSIKEKDVYLEIFQDECPESPREWDNLTKMFFFHSKYNLGDKHNMVNSDFDNWDEMMKYLIKEYETEHIYPVYMYDHSGITISLGSFNDRWDSGKIGFILIDKKTIKENNLKKKEIYKIIKSDIEIYDDYLTGNIYRFRVYKEVKCVTCGNVSEETIDSCGGFYGYDKTKNGIGDEVNLNEYKEVD